MVDSIKAAIPSLQVSSANEQDPVWSSPAETAGAFPEETIAEDTQHGAVIVTYTAADGDHGVDGTLSYEIVSVTASKLYSPLAYEVVEENLLSLVSSRIRQTCDYLLRRCGLTNHKEIVKHIKHFLNMYVSR